MSSLTDGCWCRARQTRAGGRRCPECGERPRHPHRGSPMLFCLFQLTLKISGTQKVIEEAQLLPSTHTSHTREVWRGQEEPWGSGNKQLILAERKTVDLSWKIPISLSPGQLTVHTSPNSLPLTVYLTLRLTAGRNKLTTRLGRHAHWNTCFVCCLFHDITHLEQSSC